MVTLKNSGARILKFLNIILDSRHLAIQSQSKGVCDKIFQAVGVAMPPTIQEA